MTNLISIEQFRKEARGKRKPTGAVFRVTTEPVEPVDGTERTLRFCFSDGSVDRMGDTINPNGWNLAAFSKNPVALWAHDSSQPPIGRAANVTVEGARLMGDIEFATAEIYAFADTIYRLAAGKFLNAVSVGFMPTEYSFVENDPDRGWGIDFKKQELLEISVCPVPANANALVDARAKGIDTRPLVEWAERALDGGGKVIIPKTELERLRKAAKEPPMATKPKTRPHRRADNDPDPVDGEPVLGNCGRKAEDECGMTDPAECSVHAGTKADPIDPDDEKALFRQMKTDLKELMSFLTGKQVILRADSDGDNDGDDDDPPLAHEDSIRMAHKCLRTSKAFLTEGMLHHAKAVDLLGDVVDALDVKPDDDGDGGQPNEDDPDDSEKAIRLRRAAERRERLTALVFSKL
ncbi:MAG TPA: HK97 family phage prohead protease [Chloroflexota bacterium]|jgi:HK97 family phage prohead protease